MQYHQEVLDRATGRLETKSIGDWITVTEVGQRHGVGPKKVRAILHHMGVLAQEGRRYRLPHHMVEAGVGMRHDRPKSGHPFDVISPMGQDLIASAWSETVTDYEEDCRKEAEVPIIRASLSTFKATRLSPMDTRQEVYWVLDHFHDTLLQTAAAALEVSPALVSRLVSERRSRKEVLCRRRGEPLAELSREVGEEVETSGLSSTSPIETDGMSSGGALSGRTITHELYIPKTDRRPPMPVLLRLSPRWRRCRASAPERGAPEVHFHGSA